MEFLNDKGNVEELLVPKSDADRILAEKSNSRSVMAEMLLYLHNRDIKYIRSLTKTGKR